MPEIWLRPNRRALYVGMVPPAALAIAGLTLALGPWKIAGWMQGIGWGLAVLGGLLVALLAWQARQPRLAYGAGTILVYLRSGPPIRLPVEVVECVFLGSGRTQLAGTSSRELKTANLV